MAQPVHRPFTPDRTRGQVFHTADLHLGHAAIPRLCTGRPGGTAADQDTRDQLLVDRFNSVLTPDDTLVIHGDVALGDRDRAMRYLAQILATVFAYSGNHDKTWSWARKGKGGRPCDFAQFAAAGVTVLGDHGTTTLPDGTEVNLSHFPYAGDSHGEDRYRDARLVDDGRWIIHGHVHDAWAQRGRQINVGVDARDYLPVAESDLIAIIAAGPADVDC